VNAPTDDGVSFLFPQYAQERLGTAEDITELPQEYKDLEKVHTGE
jgi:hypothetical protein